MRIATIRVPAAAIAAGLAVGPVVAFSNGETSSYAGASREAAAAAVAAALALVAASLLVKSAVLGWLTLALAVVTLAPTWAGWSAGPGWVPVVADAAVAFLAPLTVAVARAHPRGRTQPRWAAALLVVGFGWASVASITVVLVRDPFADPRCWQVCGRNPFLLADVPPLVDGLAGSFRLVVSALALGLAVVAAARLTGATRASKRLLAPVMVPATLVCVLVAAHATVALYRPESASDAVFVDVAVATSLALVLLAGGLLWPVVHAHRAERAVRRLVREASDGPAPGALGAELGAITGDPGLTIAYRVHGGSYVDAEGLPVEPGDRETVVVVRHGEPIALIEHDPAVAETLLPQLRPALVLALENEALRAHVLARLEELRESRRAIVSTGDAERRRIERDLHDGVQQRLLALQLELRTALNQARASGDEATHSVVAAAIEETSSALGEIRELAQGIYPAILADAGLQAALMSLADISPTPIVLGEICDGRLPPEVETTAYLVVAAAGEDGAQPIHVSARHLDDSLHLRLEGARARTHISEIVERVRTLDGTVFVASGAQPLVEVEIPCGS